MKTANSSLERATALEAIEMVLRRNHPLLCVARLIPDDYGYAATTNTPEFLETGDVLKSMAGTPILYWMRESQQVRYVPIRVGGLPVSLYLREFHLLLEAEARIVRGGEL